MKLISFTDPETENESQNQSAEQTTPGSQEVDLVDGASLEDSPLNSHPEPSSPAAVDSAATSASSPQNSDPTENHGPTGFDGECTYLDEDEEQSETEEDSNPNVSWGKEAQPMHPILANWNEDMEAIEMMEKEMEKREMMKKGELWLTEESVVGI